MDNDVLIIYNQAFYNNYQNLGILREKIICDSLSASAVGKI